MEYAGRVIRYCSVCERPEGSICGRPEQCPHKKEPDLTKVITCNMPVE